MKKKIISGLLCTVLLLQSLTSVGITVFAEEGTGSSVATEGISQSLSESVGLTSESINSLNDLSEVTESTEVIASDSEAEIEQESDSQEMVEKTLASSEAEIQESTQIEEKVKRSSNIIADGIYGTVPWHITKEGTLVLEGGTLEDVKASTNKKSPWVSYNSDIKNIIIKEVIVSTAYGAEALFSGLTQLKAITGLEKIDFGGALSLRYLFSNTGLQSVDANSMDVSQVTDISYIFSELKMNELNVSNWNTSKVNNVSSAFYGSTIGSLDLSHWNMENVTDLSSMFYRSTLQKLSVDNWDLGKVTSLKYIFFSANINEIIGMETWFVPNLEDATGAFHSSTFKELDLSNWKPTSIIYMTEMFREAKAESINLMGWNTKKLPNINDNNIKIFEKTDALQKISLDKDTRFSTFDNYNHKSENGHYDIWEGVKTKEIFERTSHLLIVGNRTPDTFIRKQQVYHNLIYKDYYSSGSDKKDSIKDGMNISIPSDPGRYGYEFGGWYADKDFKQHFNFSETILNDTTIYVKWVPRENRVTFNTGGGGKVPDQLILTDEQVVKPDEPKFENRYFRSWAYEVEAFGNKYYYDYDFSDPVRKDLELFARWGYILKFDTNGSDDWVSEQYFDYNSRIPVEPTQPWKKGYSFEGWYLDSQFTQRYDFSEEMDFEKNPTLYAKYKENESNVNLYGTIPRGSYGIYIDDDFYHTSSIEIYNQEEMFHITEKVVDRNGYEYYAISNRTEFLGYISTYYVTIAKGAQGEHHSYGKYVNIKGNYDIWKGFEWKNKVPGSTYKNQTLHARGYYNHFNGSRYLSVYDNKGKWIGYINEEGTALGSGQQGIYQNYGKFVSIKGNYGIWNGFDWQKSTAGSKYKNQTFQARGIYHHFNGSRYLSLYNNKGQWLGYINELGTTLGNGDQGAHQNYGKYVTINGNYNIWNGFSWQKSTAGSKYKNQTLQAKGIYHHFNGSRYLSLYDNKGKWLGYMNEKGAKVASNKGGVAQNVKFNKKIVKKNYTIWNNLHFSKKKGNSNQYLNQTLFVKVQYNHFNGSTYYSLYNSKNQWLGYIHANATK